MNRRQKKTLPRLSIWLLSSSSVAGLILAAATAAVSVSLASGTGILSPAYLIIAISVIGAVGGALCAGCAIALLAISQLAFRQTWAEYVSVSVGAAMGGLIVLSVLVQPSSRSALAYAIAITVPALIIACSAAVFRYRRRHAVSRALATDGDRS